MTKPFKANQIGISSKIRSSLFFLIVSFLIFTNCFASQKPLNVLMILWRGETIAEQGFKDEMDRLGYTVNYTVFDVAQDKGKLAKMVRKDIKFDQYDYVYTFGTSVTKVVKLVLSENTPHIFNIVADPVGAGIVKDLNAPGGNISGVTNNVPLKLQIENSHKAIAYKKLGVFFNPREKNSVLIKEELTKLAEKIGIEIISLRSPPAGPMFEENIQKLIDKSIKVDAVYFPTDSFLVSKADYIGHQLKKGKIISIGAIKKYIKKGVMLGTVTDYHTLGTMTASIVDRHQKGEKLSQIPVGIQTDPVLVINKTTADLLNVKIDETLMKTAVIVE